VADSGLSLPNWVLVKAHLQFRRGGSVQRDECQLKPATMSSPSVADTLDSHVSLEVEGVGRMCMIR
jgi:hypothetical protein